MENIIIISGAAKHGKTTAANMFKKELEQMGKKVMVTSFEDYLEFIAEKYFNYMPSQKDDPRSIKTLQHVGTDIARHKDPHFWMNVVKNLIVTFSDEFEVAVVDGASFREECELLKDVYDTTTVQILKRNFNNELGDLNKHMRETALKYYDFDYYINYEDLEELGTKVRNTINKINIK